ncbi:MAG TPA: hypothetical protein VMG82_06935 [Candidatus Sulfotelmatobacter sp.]|nr:hypothetical protein [Candidatus Sulfotelmatobacter sp.]
MKVHPVPTLSVLLFALASQCPVPTNPTPRNASAAVLQAFETHDIVMLGEIHWNKQEYAWLQSLVASPDFADRVDDVVMEFGNSLYQKSVDLYIAGEAVPIEEVRRAWRNTLGLGDPPPIYGDLYKKVRETNMRRHGTHQMRLLCGDPYIDWDKVKTKEDVGPFLGHRDQWYAQVVKEEVLAKHHHAFLIAGSAHFLREQGNGNIEPELRRAGAKTFLILAGTNAVGSYDDLDKRFDSWPAPSIALLNGNWVGELRAIPVISGGTEGLDSALKLKDAADALLYLGPRDSLVSVEAVREEVDGTPYGKELLRRMTILGFHLPYIPDVKESPQFDRPEAGSGPPAFDPPKTIDTPLPPRPPSL